MSKVVSIRKKLDRPHLRKDITVMDVLVEMDDLHEKLDENRKILDKIMRILRSKPSI